MRAFSFLRAGHIMIFHVHFFFRRFSFVIIYCPLPPLLSVSASVKTPPSLDFQRQFPFLNHRLVFLKSYLLFMISLYALYARTRFGHSFHRRFPEWLLSVLESLLLSVSPVSYGLSAQTKWRLVVSTPLIGGEGWRYSNIRREGGLVGARDCPEYTFVFSRSCITIAIICRGHSHSTASGRTRHLTHLVHIWRHICKYNLVTLKVKS